MLTRAVHSKIPICSMLEYLPTWIHHCFSPCCGRCFPKNPLVTYCYIAFAKFNFRGFTHHKWWLSIVMWVYQRVQHMGYCDMLQLPIPKHRGQVTISVPDQDKFKSSAADPIRDLIWFVWKFRTTMQHHYFKQVKHVYKYVYIYILYILYWHMNILCVQKHTQNCIQNVTRPCSIATAGWMPTKKGALRHQTSVTKPKRHQSCFLFQLFPISELTGRIQITILWKLMGFLLVFARCQKKKGHKLPT